MYGSLCNKKVCPFCLQVAVISFDSVAAVDIPLRYDEHKCNFMKELVKLSENTFGQTNAKAGLSSNVANTIQYIRLGHTSIKGMLVS